MLVILNAMVRNNLPWQGTPDFQSFLLRYDEQGYAARWQSAMVSDAAATNAAVARMWFQTVQLAR